MTTSTAPPRLRLLCHLGHDLGGLTVHDDKLKLQPKTATPGYFEAIYRASRDTLTEAIAQEGKKHAMAQAHYERFPAFYSGQPPTNPRLEELEADYQQMQAMGRGQCETLCPTPDGRALAWSCLACFREVLNHAVKRSNGPTHIGHVPWSKLANVLAAAIATQCATPRVVPTTQGTNEALRAIAGNESHEAATRRKRLARSWATPEPPTTEAFNDWERCSFRVPA